MDNSSDRIKITFSHQVIGISLTTIFVTRNYDHLFTPNNVIFINTKVELVYKFEKLVKCVVFMEVDWKPFNLSKYQHELNEHTRS